MTRHHKLGLPLMLLSAIFVLAGCNTGPSVSGAFDRNYSVTGPLRLELTNASGDVDITGSADGKVHIHGDVRASGFGFDNPHKRLDDTIANPPVEQKGCTIRLEKIERDAQLTTASGTISASDVGSELHVSTASGDVSATSVKGDVIAHAVSGVIRVAKPGARVEATNTSGEVEIQGALNDVKAHAISGLVSVQGNPGADSYWDLKSISGGVQLRVPAAANLHFSAEATSGEIRADIPIVVEEQGKHSLRAHMGSGGGRVEVHTVSGQIRVTGL